MLTLSLLRHRSFTFIIRPRTNKDYKNVAIQKVIYNTWALYTDKVLINSCTFSANVLETGIFNSSNVSMKI